MDMKESKLIYWGRAKRKRQIFFTYMSDYF
jgi:hypothetical protein